MERLTKRDEYGNADIIGVSSDAQFELSFDELNSVTNALNRPMAGGGKVEREAVRMDTTDFMQKLSQHAQQTGELMEEAVRQMEMLQAELEQARAERDAAVKELQKTKSVAFKAETSNGLCSGKLTTY